LNSNLNTAFSPFSIRKLKLKNRFIKSATYEGLSEKGRISDKLVEFHSRMAQGEVGLTTVAYGAVNAEARTHQDQMIMERGTIEQFRKLTSAVHQKGGAAMLQLTHCGFFTKNTSLKNKQPLAPSRVINSYGLLSGLIFSKAMTLQDLDRTKNDFGKAAALAIEAGFDAIEIHMGHGYLLSQFLSPKINKRHDQYGGSIENRMRFPLEVVQSVRLAIGYDTPIFCKINLNDGFKGGLTIEDSCIFAKHLEQAGVDALVLSGGYTSKTPFYLMRGDVPLKDMIKSEESFPQKMALAIFGRFIIRKYNFEENFFLPLALQIRQSVQMPLVYLGGIVSGQGIEQVMDAGFEMIALARALIHDPDFLIKVRKGEVEKSECNHCNICVAEMEGSGVRCVL
jgi:2,4-dienoyl-CoA reductase-like NADH-dependent reductase (Old Yellow Enzyme family)